MARRLTTTGPGGPQEDDMMDRDPDDLPYLDDAEVLAYAHTPEGAAELQRRAARQHCPECWHLAGTHGPWCSVVSPDMTEAERQAVFRRMTGGDL